MNDEDKLEEVRLLDVLAEVDQENESRWASVKLFKVVIQLRQVWSIDVRSPKLLKGELILDSYTYKEVEGDE